MLYFSMLIRSVLGVNILPVYGQIKKALQGEL